LFAVLGLTVRGVSTIVSCAGNSTAKRGGTDAVTRTIKKIIATKNFKRNIGYAIITPKFLNAKYMPLGAEQDEKRVGEGTRVPSACSARAAPPRE
jgi:hypothetical protein